MALGLEWLDEQGYVKMYRRVDTGDRGAISFHTPESGQPTQAAVYFTPALPLACSHMQI